MNTEDLDRLSVILETAYVALNEAWEITARDKNMPATALLLSATCSVKEAAESLAPADFPESIRA